ncbi:MAG: hypothetical protein AABY03_00090 [Nanoarchaeota archaeon]
MSKKNLENAIGEEVEITMLTNSQNIKFSGVLRTENYPMSITLEEDNGDYIIPLIGVGGGIKGINLNGKEIYSNQMLNGKYPRDIGMSGEGLKKLHEFRRKCFGDDYKF